MAHAKTRRREGAKERQGKGKKGKEKAKPGGFAFRVLVDGWVSLLPGFFEELGAAGAVAVAFVGDGVFLVVVLVVGFGDPEIGGGLDGDDDRFLEAVGLLECLFGGFGLLGLGG